MLKCTILDDYQKVATSFGKWSLIEPHVKVQSFQHHFSNEDDLVNAVVEQDILVIMRERTLFNAQVLSRLPNLKLLVTSGMRNAAIDLEYATKQSIAVCGTNNLSEPAAELAWALILGMARNIPQENLALRTNGLWQNTIGTGLNNKQLGILGLGKIGTQVAKVGKAFGMNVMAWSQNLTTERSSSCGVSLAPSKAFLLENSDFVTIHLLLSERTKNLIQAADIARMRSSAYLINTSRAPIVNENALVQALMDKRIAGAGLDVFDVEPLPMEHPFRTLPNVLATPHIGYVTTENYKIYFEQAIENIIAFLNNNPVRTLTTTDAQTIAEIN
ncbi:D-2-hydroxyacid dehydrogenase family protein [uncultured Legionella sp.]|uniref:D-2-hydroxyacid dehydrogenase family protein n=1 Tax=uncultured Legionella sp. TaxID=210934 RepID=UPI00260307E4|nr:D-2-hydroxyacid dehydrogenase family protein [uncultured Legionella sp.]